jgi:hypothetical protein
MVSAAKHTPAVSNTTHNAAKTFFITPHLFQFKTFKNYRREKDIFQVLNTVAKLQGEMQK